MIDCQNNTIVIFKFITSGNINVRRHITFREVIVRHSSYTAGRVHNIPLRSNRSPFDYIKARLSAIDALVCFNSCQQPCRLKKKSKLCVLNTY